MPISKWPEIFPMKNTDTHTTITILKRLFSLHSLNETSESFHHLCRHLLSLHSLNETSESFHHLCRSSCVTHVCAPPYHPQSNGQAEYFVDTFKCALLKAKGEGTTIEEIVQVFLLLYRTTPNCTVKKGLSPAEALLGWKLCTTLDTLCSHKQQ